MAIAAIVASALTAAAAPAAAAAAAAFTVGGGWEGTISNDCRERTVAAAAGSLDQEIRTGI